MQTFTEIKGENYNKSLMSIYSLCFLVTSLMLAGTAARERYFELNFLIEIIFVVSTLRFYILAFQHKNYTFWGISFVLSLYVIKNILQFTFVDYNILVLYLAFLTLLFLITNLYILSSPLYYPRVQWWEYDFRYRGDLKIEVTYQGKVLPGRLIDIRRSMAAIEIFEFIDLEQEILINLTYGQVDFSFKGKIQTMRTSIPGRPSRYGVTLKFENQTQKHDYLKLKKIWSMNNKVKIRRKFSELKENK